MSVSARVFLFHHPRDTGMDRRRVFGRAAGSLRTLSRFVSLCHAGLHFVLRGVRSFRVVDFGRDFVFPPGSSGMREISFACVRDFGAVIFRAQWRASGSAALAPSPRRESRLRSASKIFRAVRSFRPVRGSGFRAVPVQRRCRIFLANQSRMGQSVPPVRDSLYRPARCSDRRRRVSHESG